MKKKSLFYAGFRVSQLSNMYKEIEEALPADTPERRHWRAQFNKTEVLRKRMVGNIRLISGGKKDD